MVLEREAISRWLPQQDRLNLVNPDDPARKAMDDEQASFQRIAPQRMIAQALILNDSLYFIQLTHLNIALI